MAVCDTCGNDRSTASTPECPDDATDPATCPHRTEEADDGPPLGPGASPAPDGAATDGGAYAVKTAGRSLEPPRADGRTAPRRRLGLSVIVDLLR